MRIEIAGALGVGKSTLSKAFGAAGCHVVREDFSTNPYVELQTIDPEKYAFLSQKTFIDDKIVDLDRAIAAGHRVIVSDFSMMVELAYVDFYQTTEPENREFLHRYVEGWYEKNGLPDVIIFLHCDLETQMQRIRQRGRAFEQSYDKNFVGTVDKVFQDRIAVVRDMGWNVVGIDTTRFPLNGNLPSELAGLIASAVRTPAHAV